MPRIAARHTAQNGREPTADEIKDILSRLRDADALCALGDVHEAGSGDVLASDEEAAHCTFMPKVTKKAAAFSGDYPLVRKYGGAPSSAAPDAADV